MRHRLATPLAAIALASVASAQITSLPFDGVGGVSLRYGYADRVDGPVSGGYPYGGSGTYTPNVLVSFAGFENGVWVSAGTWPTGYNDLVNIVWTAVAGIANGGAELRLTFVADPGYVASVRAWDIGNFGNAITLPYVRVTDETGAVLFEELNVFLEDRTSPNERNFVLAQPPEGRILTLRIGLAGLLGNADNVGIDNVEFGQRAAVTAEIGTTFCDPGVTNISGGPGLVRAWGQEAVAANDVTLIATGLPLNVFGYFLASRSTGFVMGPGGSLGNLCLGGSIGRYVGPGQIGNTAASGNLFLPLDLTMMPTPTGLVPAAAGETWYFQAWHRDLVPSGGATSNFTEGLALTFQ